MTKFVLLLILSDILFVNVSNCIAQPNPVPNPSFEQWTWSDRPNGWSPVVEGIPNSPTSKSTDAHSGSFAVQGIPKQQGISDYQPPQLWSGFPINFKPVSFEGWYKFTAGNGDVLRFQVVLLSKGKKIGIASWADSVPATEYTQFISTIIYADKALPDSAYILFHTTNANRISALTSSFLVDDLSLTNDTSSTQIHSISVAESPNLNAGSSSTISWATSGSLTDSINIDVSFDGSQTWTPIQHGIDTLVHSYDWIVPNVGVIGAIIRVSSGESVAYSSPFNIASSNVTEIKSLTGFTITPNPFSTNATLFFNLAGPANAILILYDLLGREVSRLDAGTISAGYHEINIDAPVVPSGAYECVLRAGESVYRGRIEIIR